MVAAFRGQWRLHNILESVWAESFASYQQLLVGTNEWRIHNDKDCSSQSYTRNLSLRYAC